MGCEHEQQIRTGKKSKYIGIGGTEFQYYYDNGIRFFRSGEKSIAPVKVNQEAYVKILSLNEHGLGNYLNDTYEFSSYRWLARKFVEVARSSIITFFDVNPTEIERDREFSGKIVGYQKIQRKAFVEPEINKQIRNSLRRTDPKNKQ
jgi:hypothetical protein